MCVCVCVCVCVCAQVEGEARGMAGSPEILQQVLEGPAGEILPQGEWGRERGWERRRR